MKSDNLFPRSRTIFQNRKLIRWLISLGWACLLAAHSAMAQVQTTWNGGTADWENPAFWDNGVPNSPSADAFIDGGKTGIASVVSMQFDKTVGRLTLDAGDTLEVNRSLTFQAESFTGSGSIINNGTINSNGNNSILFVGNSSISGTGTINLFAAGTTFGASIRDANGSGARLTIGAGQTITGSTNSNNGGSLGGGGSTITNNGTINANTNLDSFTIAPGGGNGNDFTNGPTGIAEASNGGYLSLQGGNFNGGTFQALAGSTVSINTGAISGAILATSGSGTVTLDTDATLTNITNSGTFNFVNHTATIGGGTFTNNGTISLTGTGGSSILFSGNTSISGTGTINLFAAGTTFGNSIRSANGGGERLTIGAGQTITGSTASNNGGSLGGSNSTFTNNGTVNANTSADALLIFPGGGNGNDFTNNATGLVEASNGGVLIGQGGVFTNNGTYAVISGFTGGSSSFSLPTGSLTNFSGSTLTGGTYNVISSDPANTSTLSFGGGTIATNAANITLSGGSTIFTAINALSINQGTFTVSNGRTFSTAGALSNSGTIDIGPNGSSVGVNADYGQGTGSVLKIELGGDNPPNFHQLTATGTAHLAGTLEVTLVNGYTPPAKQTFSIIQAAALEGQFVNVIGATVTYTATEVIIDPRIPLQLLNAASRKTHGTAGDFDIDLPFTGQPGIECRSGGANGDHTLVFAFSTDLASGNASVTAGTGSVSGSPTFNDNTMTVNLTGVADVQKIIVTLSNMTDDFGQVLPNTSVSMNLLLGDTTGNKSVNASDIAQTKGQSGMPVTVTNFREDVTHDGSINAADIGLVKSRSGAIIPGAEISTEE